VQIYSEPGLGTTVTILLPATSQSAQQAPAPPLPPQGGDGETVLVVEDEAALREVISAPQPAADPGRAAGISSGLIADAHRAGRRE
jgi:hypothetical protein